MLQGSVAWLLGLLTIGCGTHEFLEICQLVIRPLLDK